MADRGAGRLDTDVEQYLVETGWDTDREEIGNGVYRVAGLDGETSRRRLILVVPAANATVTETELEWLAERATEVDADIVEVTTNGTLTPEARERAGEYGVTVQDPTTYTPQQAGRQTQPASQQGSHSPPTQEGNRRQQQGGPNQQPSQRGRGQQPPQSGGGAPRQQPPQESRGQQPPQQGRPSRQGQSSRGHGRTQPQGSVADVLKAGFRPVGGFIYGAVGYLVSFVVTTAYFFYRLNEITDGNIDLVLPDEPQALGWAFYNANMVEITSSGGQSLDYLDQISQLNPTVFYLIVAFVLFLAGYSVAARVSHPITSQEAAVTGASIVVGYLPLLAAGTILFEAQEAGASAGPELGGTLFLWAIVYTVVFGAIGGALSQAL